MKEFTILLLVLVAVTSIPQVTNAQDTSLGSRLLKNTISSTSKVIRFKSNSFIRYGFNELPREMVERADTESISLQFITRAPDGLLWIYKSNRGQKMHISLENGQLVFVHDSGRGAPQRVVVPHPDGRALNDFNWHTVRVDKEGRKLNFFIDDQQSSAQMNTDSDVQFIASGAEVFLGGIKSPSTETAGVVDTNFDGALTDVETTKIMGPNREIIISFLQYIGDTEGDIEVIDPDDWNDGKFKWGTTRPPPTTQAPVQPTPVTFKTGSSVFYLRDPVDMRSGGSINFRFRTLEPRGLIAIARGSAQSVQFFAIEVFDGLLYFVYDLGSVTSRKLFSDRRVDDGEWHEVRMNVDGNSLTLSLDGRQFSVALSQNDVRRLYFYRMYFGGYDDYSRAPWPLYSRRGFKGCMETLQINEIGYDLHVFIRNQNLQGVEIGCRTMARFCQTQPCISGYCRDRMEGYVCSCADTPYTGRNCDLNAPVAGWDGTYSTIFSFLNREVTHTNDLSFRFNTPLRNTILFRTEADNTEDFIQAELVDGRVKVTMNVDGKTKTFFTGENLNDYVWHDLNIRRRADDIEVWVDNEPKMAGVIGGENFKLIIDRIKFGSFENGGNYIGYMQNFIYDNQELFTELKQQSPNQPWLINFPFNKLPTPTYKPVTIPTSAAFVQLPSMRMGLMMKILFKFKTKESNGLIMYNGGIGSDAIAIELSNGQIRLDYNLGGSNSFTIVPTAHMLNDNKWHTVRVSLNDRGQFNVMVDDNNADVTSSDGDNRLSLSGMLYMGGLPAQMYTRPNIASLISSTKGFRGCLASVDLNGAVPDLINYSSDRTQISKGCSELGMACKPDACGLGVCTSGLNDYWCDCNMTGYTGIPCNDFPNGYYFSKQGNAGIIMYEFPYEYQQNSNEDNIAFGFMTEEENGVLYRVESSLGQDFIEIRMENGYIIAESNTGSGLKSLIEKSRKFNDGQYHVVRYIRMGNMSTLQVGALPKQSITHTGQSTLFSKVYRVIIGGRVDSNGAQRMNFNGIIGGAYYNQHRWMDLLLAKKMLHTKLVKIQGDVVLARPFLLVKGGTKTTAAPPDIVIPPGGVIPEDIGGGGVIGGGIGGSGGVPPSVIGIGGPGGIETGPTGVGVDVIAGPAPLASGLVGGPPPVSGARAGAVVGTVLGTLGFLSSLMWALYKLKPGVPTCLSPGAGKAGSGAGMSISSPRATSNLAAVQAASAPPVKPAAVNGSPAGGGSSTYTSYFQSTSTAVGGGGGAGGGGAMNASSNAAGMSSGGMASTAMVADEMDSSTLRTGGTNKRNMASSSSYSSNYQSSNTANYQSNNASNNYQSNNASNNYQSNTMQSYGSGGGSAGGGGTIDRSYDRQYMTSSSGGDNIPDYDMPMPGTMQSGQSYSSSTLNTHYNYQVQNLKTVTMNKQGQYVMSSAVGGGAVTPGAAADEVRVDCCLMTSDGRSVVTGSSLGPPQVWDMQNGELQNIMKGDTIGSTNLHLVCGDRLLVGAVHSDMEINEYSSRKGVFNHTLQIWDFMTGRPLSMAEGEYCSALCPMSDSDKVLFGRTDKFGDATSIIAWDLMGNQMIKEMRYDAPVGNNDYISYLNKSKNDRYIVAGFTNSFDNQAEFMTFDMTLTSYNISEPAMLKLDANPDVSAILPKEEVVTGLRNGDLVIWNMRTAQPSRQLLGSGGAHAHTKEVKCVALSDDSRYLVSGSADGTLKVWDMHTERPIYTLQGHTDEVCCTSISSDNEIVVSGSADGTIRLWRTKNGSEMCVFNCGVDIFNVHMSHDKGTIVALGDKYGARKLIMLQVVRTKIKKIVSS